jgi:hypothetical protein
MKNNKGSKGLSVSILIGLALFIPNLYAAKNDVPSSDVTGVKKVLPSINVPF